MNIFTKTVSISNGRISPVVYIGNTKKRLPSFWILKLVLPKIIDPARKIQCVHDINIYKLLMMFMGTD